MGCCKPDREGLRVVQLLVVLVYRSLVKLGCDFAPSSDRFSLLSSDVSFAPLEPRVFHSSRATCFSLPSSEVFFAPLERRVFRSSRATCLSLLSSDVSFAPLERDVYSSPPYKHSAPSEGHVLCQDFASFSYSSCWHIVLSSNSVAISLLSSDVFSLLWSEMFIARQPINIPLRRSGMCYARTSRRSATRRLGISFSRQTRLRFRSSRATCFSLLPSDVFSLLWSEIFIARQPINIPLRRSGMCYF